MAHKNYQNFPENKNEKILSLSYKKAIKLLKNIKKFQIKTLKLRNSLARDKTKKLLISYVKILIEKLKYFYLIRKI